jgi:hypothetical protein
MSNKRPLITAKKDLALYFKVLAEEAVRKAYEEESRESLNEADPIFGDDEEGGEEEGGDAGDKGGEDDIFGGDEGDEDEEPEQPAEEPQMEEPPQEDRVEVRPTPLTLELGEVTSDGLIATLNMIRAGRSFKEADISSELRKYFEDQLSDSERLALATFMSAIRDVTSGKAAKEAPDLGDENVNIDATDRERRERRPPQPTQAQRAALRTSSTRGQEDTTAPIQVGPSNESKKEEFRAYIKTILG